MRRALIGTLAGWLASAACVLGQQPLRGGPADAPPQAQPDRGSAGSSYSQYGRYGASHMDGGAYADQRREANARTGQGVTQTSNSPAAVNGPNGYLPGAVVQNGPMPNGNGPVIVNGNGQPAGNGPFLGNLGSNLPGNGPLLQNDPRWGNGGGYGGDGCNSCGTGNCNQGRCPCGPCGPAGRVWVSSEFLLYFMSGHRLPPLITAAPAGTPRNIVGPGGVLIPVAGVLGQPGTTILYGNQDVGTGVRPGLRIRAGMWLDECHMWGVDGSVAGVAPNPESFTSPCVANLITARPFIDFNPAVLPPGFTSIGNVQLKCFPDLVGGFATVTTRTDWYTADANVRRNLLCGPNYRVDGLAGFRFMSLNDRLTINEQIVGAANGPVAGTSVVLNDRFFTDNRFYGGQVGLAGEFRSGRVFLDWRSLIGLGVGAKWVNISGDTAITTNGVTNNFIGGLLAQQTNSGTFSTTDFAITPELTVNLGYQVLDSVRIWAGYSFMYWNQVVRAGNQVDLRLNSSQLPPGVLNGPAFPQFTMNRTDFFIQGINLGAELRF